MVRMTKGVGKAFRVGIAVLVFGLPLAVGAAAVIGYGFYEGYRRCSARLRQRHS